MRTVASSTITTKKFHCPKTGHKETATVKKVSLEKQHSGLRDQPTRAVTYPLITDCTGLKTCGIKNRTRSAVVFSWKDCPCNTSLKG